MDMPDNYYAILGVPFDADPDALKRAYRQLARRYHPDLAGPDGAIQMKRVNRAYDVLRDPEKRLNYDTIIGGTIDLRRGGLSRPRSVGVRLSREEEAEFAGLRIFSTSGPLHPGASLQSGLGVISTLNSVETSGGWRIAVGSLDGKGFCWSLDDPQVPVNFAMDPVRTIESLRELRFSSAGTLLAGWGRLSLHVWNVVNGSLLWSYPLEQRAVTAHYSLDIAVHEQNGGPADIWMALPLQLRDPLAPRVYGVRGTDVVMHNLAQSPGELGEPLNCVEDQVEHRQFWAIRLRALSQDLRSLFTLSCANVPNETEQMIVLRRWDLASRARFGSKVRPQISTAITAGLCAECTPPYAITSDTRTVAFVHAEKSLRLHDTITGTYSELPGGSMGASSRLAISEDGEWVAIAREDSEINEGVIDLWSVSQGQLMQKLYHAWQISALHFAGKQLIVALTDGTIQVWK